MIRNYLSRKTNYIFYVLSDRKRYIKIGEPDVIYLYVETKFYKCFIVFLFRIDPIDTRRITYSFYDLRSFLNQRIDILKLQRSPVLFLIIRRSESAVKKSL